MIDQNLIPAGQPYTGPDQFNGVTAQIRNMGRGK